MNKQRSKETKKQTNKQNSSVVSHRRNTGSQIKLAELQEYSMCEWGAFMFQMEFESIVSILAFASKANILSICLEHSNPSQSHLSNLLLRLMLGKVCCVLGWDIFSAEIQLVYDGCFLIESEVVRPYPLGNESLLVHDHPAVVVLCKNFLMKTMHVCQALVPTP